MNTYLHSTPKSAFLARRSNGKVNGTIDGDTFTRKVKFKSHYVWKYGGYGLDALEVDALRSAGIVNMRFVEDTGREYLTTVSEFWEQGVRDSLGGFEPQIFMPVSSMSKIEPLEYHSKAVSGVKYETRSENVTRSKYRKGGITATSANYTGETITNAPDYKQENLF